MSIRTEQACSAILAPSAILPRAGVPGLAALLVGELLC